MGFFEDSVETAKGLFNQAAKKTAETVEIQKIRLSITRKKSEITHTFTDLGRACYDNEKGNDDAKALCESLTADIDCKMEELADLEDKLAEAKKLKVCPKCCSNNSINASYCNFCGAMLDDNCCDSSEASPEEPEAKPEPEEKPAE